jgi:hypothetical protein
MSTKAEAAERARTDLGSDDYEAWFREEVQRAVKEADDPAAKWLTNEEAERMTADHFANWRKRTRQRR